MARKPNSARDLAEKYGYQTGGPVVPGNIDLHNRPVVHNADGSISTVRSITVDFGKNTYVLPTVIGGEIVSNKEAIDHFKKTGEHLGAFATLPDAEGYSQRLHEAQAKEYEGRAKGGLAEKYGVEGYAKGGSPAVLKAYKPTVRNKIAELVGGDAPQGSLRRNFTDVVVGPAAGDADRMTLADLFGVGQLLTGQEGGRDITTPGQRLKGVGEIAMSLIPEASALKGVAKGAGKTAVKEVEKLAAKYGTDVPDVRVDNPGGEWLASKQRYAEEDMLKGVRAGYAPGAARGPVTGYLDKPMLLDPVKVGQLPGAMDEVPKPGNPKYDALMKSMSKKGYDPEQGGPILVGINHRGEPHIIEGNNRAAVARDLGLPAIPADVRWYAGGERATGALSPDKLADYAYRPEAVAEKLAARYADKAPPPAVMTEVAPGQKWNATQKHEWEKLHPEAKASISNKVVEEFLPRWKRETGVEGDMVSGLGGYEGASNPNFIFRPKDPADVTKAVHGLGDLLRQDAMMAADIRPFENSSPSGVARVKLPPNVTEDQAHQVYSQLNKAGLAEGHTTDLGQGYMDILAGPGGAKTAAIRDDIAKQLNARYDVDSYDANVAFPDKGDGYGRRTSPVEPPGSSIQLGPQVLQSEAADRLEGYLREAADQGYGHKGPVTLGGLADRYNVKSGTSALPLNKADSPYMVSTRRPSASNYAEQGNPNIDLLTQSGEALRKTPGTFEKAMKLLAEEPYMSGANTTDPELLLKYGVDQGADNLSFIVNDLMSPTDVDYARRFYPAAHAEAKNAALKTGFPEQVGYGVTATTSPQTPWDINVARMSRLLNMHTSDYATDPKAVMKWVADRRAAAKNLSELGSIASRPDDWLTRVAETPMADLPVDSFDRYAKVFMSDLSQNAPTVKRFLAPGEYGDDFGKMTWGNSDIVNKSLNIMNDPSMANITEQMLGGGKVPTFFNHVANPYSKVPMATMDTHSAGAFSLFPGGGKDPVVYRTMGLSPSTGLPQAAPNSARTGTKGYYGVGADAHALAGERLGMLPAEAQAAPWGGVRTLWGEGLKTPELKKQVENIWRTAPSPDAARRAIAELLGRPVRRMFAVKPTRRE